MAPGCYGIGPLGGALAKLCRQALNITTRTDFSPILEPSCSSLIPFLVELFETKMFKSKRLKCPRKGGLYIKK